MIKRRRGFVLFVSLLAVLLIGSVMFSGVVKGAEGYPSGTGPISDYIKGDITSGWRYDLGNRVAIWETGLTDANYGLIGNLLKYLVLILVIILVYSALMYVKFPESNSLKLLLAVVIGVIATFAITSAELLSALHSYTAMGVTLILFFPILILGFLTIMVASVANPFGIFLQRIMWLIYSIYLFIKTGLLLLVRLYWNSPNNYLASSSFLNFS